jgi:hypothetical protein
MPILYRLLAFFMGSEAVAGYKIRPIMSEVIPMRRSPLLAVSFTVAFPAQQDTKRLSVEYTLFST